HKAGGPARAEFHTNQLSQPPYPEAAVMMTFVNMDADGLVILPTHRVVHSLEAFDPVGFRARAGQFFAVDELPPEDAAGYLNTLKGKKGTAFVAVTRTAALLLCAKPEAMATALAGLPERQRQLDLTQLHSIVLDRLLGLDA